MRPSDDRARAGLESANTPGNPLRSYRMSMLAHGFVDQQATDDFAPDETDPMAYGVVRRSRNVPVGSAVFLVVVILIVVVAAFAA